MNRLRHFREERGLRREDIASQANISYEYVRRLETSDPPTPGLDVARRIADALGVTVDEVFPEAPETEPLVEPVPNPSGGVR